jgi:protein PhnA
MKRDNRENQKSEPIVNEIPPCPKCQSEFTYFDGSLYICPDCQHEWSGHELETVPDLSSVTDANGVVLADGDSVTVVKDLKLKGSSTVIKVGTKVKNIRLKESSDGHNIGCKIDGVGTIDLKSEFVKKV